MSTLKNPPGIAVFCDEPATIQQVIWDGLGMDNLLPGQPLEILADAGSRVKLLNFLVELRGKGTAINWEINLWVENKAATFQLSGVSGEGTLMIIAAQTPLDAMNLCNKFTPIHFEQTAVLRAALQGQSLASRGQGDRNSSMFDDISQLNNELVTLQRDLAKKNAELEILYAEVQKQAITDPLTNVFNRRGFFDLGNREVERAKRYCSPLAGLIFDFDDFKKINDTYGHEIGDLVLKKSAARCTKLLRKVDIFGRYGGDEFSVLLPQTPMKEALVVAERMRKSVGTPLEIGQDRLTANISIGVAVLTEFTADLDMLLRYADRALYKAKEAGGNNIFPNQVEVQPPPLSPV